MCRTRPVLMLLLAALTVIPRSVNAEHVPGRVSDFFVLRSGRITGGASTGHWEDPSCSIIGTGYGADMQCNSYSPQNAIPPIYNIALFVGSDGVGYVVKCGGGLLRRIDCHPLTAGIVLPGVVTGDKISISEGGKTTTYHIVTSAFVGKLPQQASPEPKAPSAGLMILFSFGKPRLGTVIR